MRRATFIGLFTLSHLLTFCHPARGDDSLAARIAAEATYRVGFGLDVGCGDAALAVDVARRTGLKFECIDPDAAAVAAARKAIDAGGLYGTRASADRASLGTLHYPDYCASLVICGDQFVGGLRERSFAEIVRVLHPKGVAYVGQSAEAAKRAAEPLTKAMLEGWLKAAGVSAYEIIESDGVWARIHRPAPVGWDEWRHRSHDPANTYASDDTIGGGEFNCLWVNRPQPGLASAAVLVADGLLIEIGRGYAEAPDVTPYIQVSDAFTGIVRWAKVGRKQVGIDRPWADYSAIRSCSDVAAMDGRLYVLGDKFCHVLDLADGRHVAAWPIPPAAATKAADIWLYLACVDGLLVGTSGRSPQHRTGWGGTHWRETSTAVFAIERATGKVKWTRAADVHTSSIVIAAGRLLAVGRDMTIHCLDTATGEELWRKPTKLPAAGRVTNTALHAGRYWVLYAPDGDTSSQARDDGWRVAVFSAADGTLVCEPDIKTPVASLTAHDEVVYMAPQHGVGTIVTLDATTAEVTGSMLPRPTGSKCTPLIATPKWLLYRHQAGSGFVRIDRKTLTTYTYSGIRCTCQYPGIPANGLLYIQGPGCNCAHPFRGNAAVMPVLRHRYAFKDEDERLVKGPAYDVPPADAAAAVWVGWRGDASRSGITAEAPAGVLKEAWRSRLTGALTPVAAGDGLLFVGSTNRKLAALDAATGEPRWQFIAAGRIRVTPHLWRGRVYFGDDDGWAYCVLAADGRLVWKFKVALGPDRVVAYEDFASAWPAGNGVVVHGELAYCTAGFFPEEKGRLYALDAVTGRYRWSRDQRFLVRQSYEAGFGAMAVGKTLLYMPTVGGPPMGAYLDQPDKKYSDVRWRGANAPRGTQVMALGDEALLASADLRYIHHVSNCHDMRRALPIVTDTTIYLRAGDRLTAERRAAYTLRPGDGEFTWVDSRLVMPQASPNAADLLWTAWPDAVMTAAILAGNTLFSGGDGAVYATDAASGRPLWSAAVGGAVGDLAFQGGRLFVVTDAGAIHCFAASAP